MSYVIEMNTAGEASGESYKALAALVAKETRWSKKATGRILLELGVHLTLMFGGIAFFLATDSLFLKAVAFLVSTAGALGLATNTHSSSHNATSNLSWLNKALTYFGYTFFFGASAHYWWHKHCVVHHPYPNLIGIDEDVNLAPWFAITEDEFQRSRGLKRLYYRLQWLLIPFAIGLNLFNVQAQSWSHLIGQLRQPRARTRAHLLDLGIVILHYAVWLVAPMFIFGAVDALAFYVIRGSLVGYAMFIAFAPAHFPAETAFVAATEQKADYVLRQTISTVNFRTGFLGRLFCSGVDYQIEHHLFPRISHIYYPELSPLVEEFCRRHNYPYRSLGWGEGIWKSLVTFYRPKTVLQSLREAPHAIIAQPETEMAVTGAV